MSCRGDERLVRQLPPERRAALTHIHIANSSNIMTALHVICTAIEVGGPGVVEAGASGLNRCEIPDFNFWLPAVLILATDDNDQIQARRSCEIAVSVNRISWTPR